LATQPAGLRKSNDEQWKSNVLAAVENPAINLVADLALPARRRKNCVLRLFDGFCHAELCLIEENADEVHAYEFDLKRHGQAPRLLVLNAHKLDYDDKEQIRLLVALADVTDSRASEKLKDTWGIPKDRVY
jgi:hypothetical protein